MSTEQLVDRSERLVDQLRSMPEARLERAGAGEPSIADSAHALAQVLADLAADLEGRARREVPRLHPLASGDQVAVLSRELAAAADSPRTFTVGTPPSSAGNDRAPAGVAIDIAVAAIAALRDQM